MVAGDGLEFHCTERRGRLRWSRHADGPCAREDVDAVCGAGFARSVEAVWRGVTDGLIHEWTELRERASRIADIEREARTVGRHVALRKWRGSNPVPPSQRPPALRGVRGARRMDPDQPCRVYFLLDQGEVVYVGQTSAPWPARIETHLAEGDKVFDEVWYVETDAASLNATERHYIKRFQPRYNVKGVPSNHPAAAVQRDEVGR